MTSQRDPVAGPRRASRRRLAALGAAVALLAAACSGPILANPPASVAAPASPTAPPSAVPDPQPIVLPRDDGPHDRLTEWWYYTGHLADDAGGHWGFELVVFRAERGGFPVAWASHFALTDEAAGTFTYDQRSAIGSQVDRSEVDRVPFSFLLPGPVAPGATGPTPIPSIEWGSLLPTSWAMAGNSGSADLVAAMDGGRYGIQLRTDAAGLPPVLHGADGWVDFGPAGGSYYYSRPRLAVAGILAADGQRHDVQGTAWFDHQWGDFIAVGGGGWDWFAVNLADGTDLTISLVRAADGTFPLVYGTLVDPTGAARHLAANDFTVTTDPGLTWTSPTTGATYPAGWTLRVPSDGLDIHLRPTVPDQELDTRATTGVVYWEGSQVVTATHLGQPVAGEAYVELTGYPPAEPTGASPTPTSTLP
jgi:predicted secreted hydrolase